MNLAAGTSIRQTWTAKKVACYLVYRLFAKHIPDDLDFVGRCGRALRRRVCRPLFRESEAVFSVGQGADFGNGANVILRDCANLGPYAFLSGDHATVTIGRHVMMGSQCIIICQNHRYLEEGYAGCEGKDVVIDDYAWIGHRVTILPGVRIGRHAIIGAGAVVSKSIPDYGIAVGNPARTIKLRKQNHG